MGRAPAPLPTLSVRKVREIWICRAWWRGDYYSVPGGCDARGNPTPEALRNFSDMQRRWIEEPGWRPGEGLTVVELLALWHDSPNAPSNLQDRDKVIDAGLRLNEWRNGLKVEDFRAGELEEWQRWLCELPSLRVKGKTRYAASTVKKLVGHVRSAYRWGLRNERPGCTAATLLNLNSVPGPKPGKVRKSKKVLAADKSSVDAVAAILLPDLAAAMRLHWLTGARPSELLTLRVSDVVQTGVLTLADGSSIDLTAFHVWGAAVDKHKTEGKGGVRALFFGPKCQAILTPLLEKLAPSDYLFSPARGMAWLRDKQRSERIGRGNKKRPAITPVRVFGEFYSSHAYNSAVRKACEKLKVKSFHSYQIRHSAAMAVQEAQREATAVAGAVLGHSGKGSQAITLGYSKTPLAAAAEVARKHG